MRVAAALIGLCSLCLILPAGARAEETIIIFDAGRSVDFATGLCNEAKHWMESMRDRLRAGRCEAITNCTFYLSISDACSNGDMAREVHRYDDDVKSWMAGLPRCSAISIAQYEGPKASLDKAVSDAMKTPHWALSFNYVPGAKRQKWTMIHSITSVHAKGEGDPKETANSVCLAARSHANILTHALPY